MEQIARLAERLGKVYQKVQDITFKAIGGISQLKIPHKPSTMGNRTIQEAGSGEIVFEHVRIDIIKKIMQANQ